MASTPRATAYVNMALRVPLPISNKIRKTAAREGVTMTALLLRAVTEWIDAAYPTGKPREEEE